MLCGDDELWRDSTGTILDMREDDPNVLVCMQACNYSIDPVSTGLGRKKEKNHQPVLIY